MIFFALIVLLGLMAICLIVGGAMCIGYGATLLFKGDLILGAAFIVFGCLMLNLFLRFKGPK